MFCPKCEYEQADDNRECERCGIIFTKYFKLMERRERVRQGTGDATRKSSSGTRSDTRAFINTLLFHNESPVNSLYLIGRAAIFAGLVFWGVKFCFASIESNYAGRSFMHLINLPFHEAGHIFFQPFGSLMTSLGGTLGQLLMPLLCFFALLLKNRDNFGASVALWWFGQNFFDIAPYVNDARSLSLPLLGGNVGRTSPYGFHDWEYILTETGLRSYDHFLAGLAVTMGVTIFIVSYAWGAFLLWRQYRKLADE